MKVFYKLFSIFILGSTSVFGAELASVFDLVVSKNPTIQVKGLNPAQQAQIVFAVIQYLTQNEGTHRSNQEVLQQSLGLSKSYSGQKIDFPDELVTVLNSVNWAQIPLHEIIAKNSISASDHGLVVEPQVPDLSIPMVPIIEIPNVPVPLRIPDIAEQASSSYQNRFPRIGTYNDPNFIEVIQASGRPQYAGLVNGSLVLERTRSSGYLGTDSPDSIADLIQQQLLIYDTVYVVGRDGYRNPLSVVNESEFKSSQGLIHLFTVHGPGPREYQLIEALRGLPFEFLRSITKLKLSVDQSSIEEKYDTAWNQILDSIQNLPDRDDALKELENYINDLALQTTTTVRSAAQLLAFRILNAWATYQRLQSVDRSFADQSELQSVKSVAEKLAQSAGFKLILKSYVRASKPILLVETKDGDLHVLELDNNSNIDPKKIGLLFYLDPSDVSAVYGFWSSGIAVLTEGQIAKVLDEIGQLDYLATITSRPGRATIVEVLQAVPLLKDQDLTAMFGPLTASDFETNVAAVLSRMLAGGKSEEMAAADQAIRYLRNVAPATQVIRAPEKTRIRSPKELARRMFDSFPNRRDLNFRRGLLVREFFDSIPELLTGQDPWVIVLDAPENGAVSFRELSLDEDAFPELIKNPDLIVVGVYKGVGDEDNTFWENKHITTAKVSEVLQERKTPKSSRPAVTVTDQHIASVKAGLIDFQNILDLDSARAGNLNYPTVSVMVRGSMVPGRDDENYRLEVPVGYFSPDQALWAEVIGNHALQMPGTNYLETEIAMVIQIAALNVSARLMHSEEYKKAALTHAAFMQALLDGGLARVWNGKPGSIDIEPLKPSPQRIVEFSWGTPLPFVLDDRLDHTTSPLIDIPPSILKILLSSYPRDLLIDGIAYRVAAELADWLNYPPGSYIGFAEDWRMLPQDLRREALKRLDQEDLLGGDAMTSIGSPPASEVWLSLINGRDPWADGTGGYSSVD